MIKLGDKVRIINKDAYFYGCIGVVDRQGNGTCWQVLLDNAIGVYYFEKELEIVK